MQKIPTLFVRDPSNPKAVTAEVNPDCAWVLAGEGIATRKPGGLDAPIRFYGLARGCYV